MILLPIHIVSALSALAAGAVAMAATKGNPLHRKSGIVFSIAMLTMTSSAVLMATFWHPNRINVVAGVLTFYLVGTGLLTVRRSAEQMRGLTKGFMLMALATSIYGLSLGFTALHSADGQVDRMSPPPFFMFGIVGLLGALGDARLLWVGSFQGSRRIARHLWRMTFAMWIATTSLFLGQAKHFPEAIRHSGLLPIPVLLVTGFLLYWLVRVRLTRRSAANLRQLPGHTAREQPEA